MLDIVELLEFCVKQNASDLHIASGTYPRMRVQGELLVMQETHLLDAETTKKFIFSMMNTEQQHQFDHIRDLDFSFFLPNVGRFRVNAFYQSSGAAAVLRIIPKEIPPLIESAVFQKLVKLSSGLIVVTGATGSGKSTTLASMIDYINKHHCSHIITIEDPIEFVHTHDKSLVNQREVYRDTRDFHSALRSALREDPDVILIGEMRDLETIRLALTAAETGHLVLTTLHTSSAPRAIHRIIEAFPGDEKNRIRNQLAEALQAVIYQVLVKTYAGIRTPVFEVMLGTPAIRNLIREDKIAQMYTVMQTSAAMGMCTLQQSLQDLIDRQIICKSVMTMEN